MEENIKPSKSLVTINILFKVFYILSIIFMIMDVISAISGISLSIVVLNSKDKLVGPDGGMPLYLKILVDSKKRISVYTVALALLNAGIYSIGAFIMCNFSRKYFKARLADGTPFTPTAGNGMKKLGFIHIITGFAVILVCTICFSIFYGVFHNDYRCGEAGVTYIGFGWTGLGFGLIFLVISLFINAALENKNNDLSDNK